MIASEQAGGDMRVRLQVVAFQRPFTEGGARIAWLWAAGDKTGEFGATCVPTLRNTRPRTCVERVNAGRLLARITGRRSGSQSSRSPVGAQTGDLNGGINDWGESLVGATGGRTHWIARCHLRTATGVMAPSVAWGGTPSLWGVSNNARGDRDSRKRGEESGGGEGVGGGFTQPVLRRGLASAIARCNSRGSRRKPLVVTRDRGASGVPGRDDEERLAGVGKSSIRRGLTSAIARGDSNGSRGNSLVATEDRGGTTDVGSPAFLGNPWVTREESGASTFPCALKSRTSETE